MDLLHVSHLIIVAAWGGLILGEVAIELSARDDSSRRVAASAHRAMDIYVEAPLLAAIAITGVVLLFRVWPLTSLHLLKIGCALAAMAFNVRCLGLVLDRHLHRDDPNELERLTRRIRFTGLGLPFGIVAAVLGLIYFHV